MRTFAAIVFLTIACMASAAEEIWKVETLALDGEGNGGNFVLLRWEGRFINDTAVETTLHAVLELKDRNGVPLQQLETSAVKVPRFGKMELKEKFQITHEIWEKTKSLSQWGRAP